MANITAKNYAAQAEKDVLDYAKLLKTKYKGNAKYTPDWEACEILGSEIKHAVHFAMPDHGVIFDDGARGLYGRQFRLPFSCITVEYYVPEHETNPVGLGHVYKR